MPMSASEEHCSTIGGKIVNGVCMVDGYPAATGKQITVSRIYDMFKKCEVLHLRPEDYLKLVPKTIINESIVDELKKKIQNKEPLDIPWIDISHEECGYMWKLPCIIGHEGRHRAVAAKEKGINKIPVFLCYL